jgi:hypothetical protein
LDNSKFEMGLHDLMASSVLQQEARSLSVFSFSIRYSRRSGFPSGRVNMYHTLLVKGLCEDGLPLTRDAWYRN